MAKVCAGNEGAERLAIRGGMCHNEYASFMVISCPAGDSLRGRNRAFATLARGNALFVYIPCFRFQLVADLPSV